MEQLSDDQRHLSTVLKPEGKHGDHQAEGNEPPEPMQALGFEGGAINGPSGALVVM